MKRTAMDILWTRSFSLTMVAILFLFIPFVLFLPVLPVYLLKELHSSMSEAGAVNGIFLLAVVLFRGQAARLEARFGVRRVVLVSGFMFMATNLLYIPVDTITGVMLIRFLSGACFAVVNTSLYAMGSRLISDVRKGEGMAYLATMMLVGGAIGPYIGLKLSHTHGYQVVFIFSALISLFGLLIAAAIFIPEDKPAVLPNFSFQNMYEFKAIPSLLIMLVCGIAYGGVFTFVAIYATDLRLPYVVEYFFVAMAGSSVVSRLATSKFYDRFGPNASIYPAILFLAVGLLLLGSLTTTLGLLAAAALIGVGLGMSVPSVQTLAIQLSPVHRSSAVTATIFTCYDVGICLGAYLLGEGIHAFGYATVYLALGVVTLCCILPYYVLYARACKDFRPCQRSDHVEPEVLKIPVS